jgi:electron transfer flavoprotein alpha subunit
MFIVFIETEAGVAKKASLEALSFARKLSNEANTACHAIVLGRLENQTILGTHGAQTIYHDSNEIFNACDTQVLSSAIASLAGDLNVQAVIMAHSALGKSIAGRVAIKLKASMLSAVNELPKISGTSWLVKKGVFSGKAFATFKMDTPVKVLTVVPNAFKADAIGGETNIEERSIPVEPARTKLLSVDKVKGIVPLPEAERVVSAGRGMKGPENWGIIEELAETLGATTACSRPVSDTGWRPHHEHVGQTGIAIRPTLYIAIGISGAIQHLAGVNRSKVIVVINKDPEAPFFKAADYGVVGDLFEIVPKLNTALKKAFSA